MFIDIIFIFLLEKERFCAKLSHRMVMNQIEIITLASALQNYSAFTQN